MVAITVTLAFKVIHVHGPKFEKEPKNINKNYVQSCSRGQAEVYYRVFLFPRSPLLVSEIRYVFLTQKYASNAGFVKFPFFMNSVYGSLYFSIALTYSFLH